MRPHIDKTEELKLITSYNFYLHIGNENLSVSFEMEKKKNRKTKGN